MREKFSSSRREFAFFPVLPNPRKSEADATDYLQTASNWLLTMHAKSVSLALHLKRENAFSSEEYRGCKDNLDLKDI